MKLSKSALDDFKRCPRCFWLAKTQNMKQPEGIKSGLPMGMDSLIKKYHDRHRLMGTMPPELVGRMPGVLFADQTKLNRWRNWRSALEVQIGPYTLSGMFDDLIFDEKTGLYAGYDYKTRGSAPPPGYSEKYYETQASAYDAILNGNGMKTSGVFYFSYFYPLEILENGRQTWGVDVQAIKTSVETLKLTVMAAGKCLEGPLPEPAIMCELCSCMRDRDFFESKLKQWKKEEIDA